MRANAGPTCAAPATVSGVCEAFLRKTARTRLINQPLGPLGPGKAMRRSASPDTGQRGGRQALPQAGLPAVTPNALAGKPARAIRLCASS